MSMDRLRDIVNDFGTSRPIFKLNIRVDDRCIDASTSTPMCKYRPIPILDDALSKLACSNFSEHFNVSEGIFYCDKDSVIRCCIEDIKSFMIMFVEKHYDMKNPRQSKLYRWLCRDIDDTDDMNNILIMVYKYLYPLNVLDGKCRNDDHAKNGIALLKAIMVKYEK